jgi:hypothetical protein
MPPRAKAEVELTIQATECSKKRAAALGRTGSGSSQGGNVESLTRLQRHAKPGSCRIAFDIAPKPSRRGTAPKQEGKDLDFDGAPYWAGEIDQVLMLGNVITTEVVFFHAKSATVLFADLVQQLPANWFSGWRALVAKWDLMVAPEPSVPRKFRLAFTNRSAARASLEHVLSWPAKKVLMAHGTPVREDGREFIGRAFRWLTPTGSRKHQFKAGHALHRHDEA